MTFLESLLRHSLGGGAQLSDKNGFVFESSRYQAVLVVIPISPTLDLLLVTVSVGGGGGLSHGGQRFFN